MFVITYRYIVSILTPKYVPTEKGGGGQVERIGLEAQEGLKEIRIFLSPCLAHPSCFFVVVLLVIMYSSHVFVP